MKKNRQGEFSDRFSRLGGELKRLHDELYHTDEEAWSAFAEMLRSRCQERSESFRAPEPEWKASPDWYRGHGLTAMQMDADAFAGTLQGLREKLDYLTECGVNCLCLMPPQENPQSRSGSAEERPETPAAENLRNLAEECHRRGIALCMDFVLSHTSGEHEWARRARAGEKDYADRYFLYDSPEIPNAYDQTVPQALPVTSPGNFTLCPETGKLVMTTFHPDEWDLNYMNPAVLREMTEKMLDLCILGADIIRLDGAPYLWKALGTTCRNLRRAHTLVRILRLAGEIACPGTLLLGETLPPPGEEAWLGTAGRPECHLLENTSVSPVLWHTAATKDTRLLAHQLRRLFSLPREHIFLNALRCRGGIGWDLDYGFLRCLAQEEAPHRQFLNDYLTGKWEGSPARGELCGEGRIRGTAASLCGVRAARGSGDREAMERALQLDRMLHALIFTLSGIPVIYGGDETAAENSASGEGADGEKAALRRKKNTPESRMFAAVRQLGKLRREHAAFDAGADTWLPDTGNLHVLGIGRYFRGEQLLAFFNFSDQPQEIWIGDGKIYRDLVSGEETDAVIVSLESGSFRWLMHTF